MKTSEKLNAIVHQHDRKNLNNEQDISSKMHDFSALVIQLKIRKETLPRCSYSTSETT